MNRTANRWNVAVSAGFPLEQPGGPENVNYCTKTAQIADERVCEA
jgi:hypothetical protein